MNKNLREEYNRNFKQEVFDNFIKDIKDSTGGRLDFKVCETPLFLDKELTEELIKACDEIVEIIQLQDFKERSKGAIPPHLVVPGEDEHPVFLQIDFGITIDKNKKLLPQLIELQGFPSLYAYQAFLESKVREHFQIPKNYTAYYNDLNFESYLEMLRNTIVGKTNPENVILLEIEPEVQKTRIDFYLTEKYTGIKSICVSDIIKKGNNLFYRKNDMLVPIERIYNRVIFDELLSKDIKLDFSFADDLNVKWVGHPNWFYKISKYNLPLIKSKYNPICHYLNDLEYYPADLKIYVLKPLFSFCWIRSQD